MKVSATERTVEFGIDRDRMSELYIRHVGRAVGLARLVTNNDALAEEIAHEAFIRVAGRFGDLRHAEAFEPYLRRTVVNCAERTSVA
jgi:DNA-directed RNA polymerase specialized sigma24 family protein